MLPDSPWSQDVLMGLRGLALCWPGSQDLRMGSGIPKEEEGRPFTVYKETCVVLVLSVRKKTLTREQLLSYRSLVGRMSRGEC